MNKINAHRDISIGTVTGNKIRLLCTQLGVVSKENEKKKIQPTNGPKKGITLQGTLPGNH